VSIADIQEQLTGGESVYCINEAQMRRTSSLMLSGEESGRRLRAELERIEGVLNRNERAALAFTLIQRLNAAD
jgi:hypothetical protein